MRLAIISDIHGNLEALKEVLADIDHAEVDGVACLGDNIGYGPDPEEVVRLVRKRNIPCVMGNHELAILNSDCLECMNPSASRSVCITQRLLSEETLEYIQTLKPSMLFHGSLCVHGCPPDSITTYLFEVSREQLGEVLRNMPQKVCFAGHTHDLVLIRFDGKEVKVVPLRKGIIRLQKNCKYIVNAGSVGQPRDGNNNAKYVIWDNVSGTIEVRFIPYDIAATADKILKLGFPEFNAERLW